MPSNSYLRVAALAAGVFASTASAVFDPAGSNNVVMYWGQGSDQITLSEVCNDPSIDIVNIAFVNGFPKNTTDYPATNFANACDGTTFTRPDGIKSGLLKGCAQIGPGIKECQAKGKKVLLSIGGGYPTDYYLPDEPTAKYFANFLWSSFGPQTAAVVKANSPRPFGDAAVDGFDLDIESYMVKPPFASYQYLYYNVFVDRLRYLMGQQQVIDGVRRYISAAPQCVIPDARLADSISKSNFDWIFVQFYNTPECSTRAGYNGLKDVSKSTFTFDKWVSWLKTNSFNKNVKLYMGMPGAVSGAPNDAPSYLTPTEANKLITYYKGKQASIFGGVMLWEATAAARNTICGQGYGTWIKKILTGKFTNEVCPTTSSSYPSTTKVSSSASSTPISTTSSAVYSSSSVSSSSSAVYSSSSSSAVYSSSSSSAVYSSSSSSAVYSSSSSSAVYSSSSSSAVSSSSSSVVYSSSSPVSSSPSSTPYSTPSATPSSTPVSSSTSVYSSSSASSSSSSSSQVYSSTSVASSSSAVAPSSSSSSAVYSSTQGSSTQSAVYSSGSSSTPCSSSATVYPTGGSSTSNLYTASFSVSSVSYSASSTGGPYQPSSSSTPCSSSTKASSTGGPYSPSSSPSSASSTGGPYSPSSSSTPCSSSTKVSSTGGPYYPSSASSTGGPYYPSSSGTAYYPHSSGTAYYPSSKSTPCSSSSSAKSTGGPYHPSSKSTGAPYPPVSTHKPYPHSSSHGPVYPSTVTTTVITTSYVDICPTGLTTVVTTYTTTTAYETAAKPTSVVPEGWYTTVTVCTVCGPKPTTVTLTKPVTVTVTAAEYTPAPYPTEIATTIEETSTSTTYVYVTLTKVPVPASYTASPVPTSATYTPAPYPATNGTATYIVVPVPASSGTGVASSSGYLPSGTYSPTPFEGAASRFGAGILSMVAVAVAAVLVL